jgi:hypothetical protein
MKREFFILFLVIFGLNMALVYLNNHFLITDEVAETAVHGNYNESHVQKWKNMNEFYTSFKYIKNSVSMFFTVLLSAGFLYLLLGMDKAKVAFTQILVAVTAGYACLMLPELITFFRFAVFEPDFTYTEFAHYANPLSLGTYLDIELVNGFWGTLTRNLNLEYLLFIGVIAAQLYKTADRSFWRVSLYSFIPAVVVISLSVCFSLLFN